MLCTLKMGEGSFAILSESTGSGSTKYTEMDWWVNGKDTNVGCLDDIQGKGHTPCLTSSILQLNKGDYVEVRSHLRTYVEGHKNTHDFIACIVNMLAVGVVDSPCCA